MPEKVEVIPFYTKRAKVKNVIRAKKLDIETPACNDSNLKVAKKEKSFPPLFLKKKKKIRLH